MSRKLFFLAAAVFGVAPAASAVELTWDEGVRRARVYIEASSYEEAKSTVVILLRDYPGRDDVFALDALFAAGDYDRASRLLSRLARSSPEVLFDASRDRVYSWSVFTPRRDALEYHLASNPGDVE